MQYDVFISCKSEDYKYAEEIYEFLEANGIHTFLASKELRKIGRSLYREAIDDAIDSSYHLIVFSSKSDYVSSDWVKYEWDFFLTLQLSEKRPGQMITILKDVNIKELPKTFLRCQSFFYSSFREDLLRYVETPAFLQRKKKKIQEEQYENADLNIKVGIDGDIEPKVGRGKKRLLSRLTRLFDTEEHDANNFFEKGCNCYFGENVQQNYVQAVYWFKRAAELGNASAQFI